MATKPRQHERRRNHRVRGRFRLGLDQAKFGSLLEAQDLSLSGVCFRMSQPLSYMTRVQLVLWLPNREGKGALTEFPTSGVVVRCEPAAGASANSQPAYDVAVFFTELPETTLTALHEYVHAHIPIEHAT